MFTWSTNKQKFSNNISIKKADKQVNRQQQHCKQLVYIYRDFAKAKMLSFKCNIKGKTEQATILERVNLSGVWWNVAYEDNNHGLNISVVKIYWTIVNVYVEEV